MVSAHRYLIFAGTTRAASTSLFCWLADHPEVCAASLKETRFFLDEDYPIAGGPRCRNDAEPYERYFNRCPADRVRMEATPDYLHSPGTAARIARFLPEARLVFVLRDPVERMVSWYRYARQLGWLPKDMEFVEFVERQRPGGKDTTVPQHLRVMEQGLYARYLATYFEAFDPDRLRVLLFPDLCSNPMETVQTVCRFTGIDPLFYRDYPFRLHNASETLHVPRLHGAWQRLRDRVGAHTHGRPRLHGILRRLKSSMEPLYLRLNRATDSGVPVKRAVVERLRRYHERDVERLERLLGKRVDFGTRDR